MHGEGDVCRKATVHRECTRRAARTGGGDDDAGGTEKPNPCIQSEGNTYKMAANKETEMQRIFGVLVK